MLSSTIELPHVPFSVVSGAERGCSSHVGAIRLWSDKSSMASTPVADLCWGGTNWGPSSPIRLDDFALCKLRAAGDTARRGDVVIDRGHITPSRMVMLLRHWVNMTTLADGKDTVKCCDFLSYGDNRELT